MQKGEHDEEEVDYKDVFKDLMLRMAMDRVNTVNSFEEIGLTDPIETQDSLEKAKKIVSQLSYAKTVYPSKVIDPLYKDAEDHPHSDIYAYPKCIFIPSKALMRQILTVMVKFAALESE